jgi:hypothetical protein
VKETDRWGVGEWNRLRLLEEPHLSERRERQRGDRVVVGERENKAQSYGGYGQSFARCRRYIISSSSCPSCSIVASHASPVSCLQAAHIPCSLTSSPGHLHHVAHIKRARRALKTLDALFYEWCYQLLEIIITLHTPKLLTNDSNPRNSALGTRNSSTIQASGRTRITFDLTKNK